MSACSGGDDEPPPEQDAGPTADGPTADGPTPDGSPPDASGDHTPPTITATDPADGATGVEPVLAIAVSFDEPVTVSEPADGLRLLDEADQPVPGAVEVDGDVIRFVPADDLALLGAYTAVVTTAVTDLAGNPLAAEHRFQLSVRDGAWETTGTLIENNDSGNARTPDVAMDPHGSVAVVWSHEGTPSSIWASYYDAGAGTWGTAQPIEHDDAGNAAAPRVAMDGAGNAIAVWQQSDGTRTHVWASRHDGTAWGSPVRLDVRDAANAQAPRIAMNDDGAAIVVWRQVEGSTRQAWINRYVAGTGWGVAEPVQIFGQPASINGAVDPAVGIDGQGDAMVIVLDSSFHVMAVPHHAASGWGEAVDVIRGPVEGIDLAMAPSGHVSAIWHYPQPSRIQAWRRDPGGAARLDVLIEVSEEDRGQVRPGSVAVNAAGDSVALTYQDSPWPSQLWASTSSAAQAWSEPQGLLTDHDTSARGAQVGIDPRSHAHASWITVDGSQTSLMLARRVAPGSFGEPVVQAGIEGARLAVNAQGKAVVIRSVPTSCPETGTRIDLDAIFFR